MTTPGASTPGVDEPASKVVLLGRGCGNTATAQAVLQQRGIDLAAVVLADQQDTPAQVPGGPGSLPTFRVAAPRATTRLLQDLRPDLVIAACYPWRLSRKARAAARCGILNIHPSPLPHGRGPDPVFWVYRHGEQETGVTIHLMDDDLDSGPVLAWQRLAVPAASNVVALEQHLFARGAHMAAGLAPEVLEGNAVAVPQDNLAATYNPAPGVADWAISPLLPAAWAWRFVQGVAPLHGPLAVHTRGELVPVRSAIAWGERGDPPAQLPAGAFLVQFRPGWIVFA